MVYNPLPAFNHDISKTVGVAQLVEPWIVAPVVAGSSPVAHPTFYAPVAQLDRVPDFESVGRPFESDRAHFVKQPPCGASIF